MKFLLDEDIAPAVASGLRERGLDALSVHDLGRLGLADGEQLAYAIEQGRVLVTYNRGDYQILDRLYRLRGASHRGILWIPEGRVPRRSIGTLIRALLQIAEINESVDGLCLPLSARTEPRPDMRR